MSNFLIIFYWYLIFFLFGMGLLPLITIIFPLLRDKGYAFSKLIGVLLFSYTIWLLSSFKIFNFQWAGIWLLLLLAIPWLLAFYKFPFIKEQILQSFKKLKKIWFLEELIFLFALFFWCFIRSQQPNIDGLEKYMDFGFVNSILRSGFMPPKDMWLTGFTINYYYFGHFIAAFLIKLSSIPAQFGYNLMLSTVFSLAVSTAFSFVYNFSYVLNKSSVKLNIFAGLLAAELVNLAGNLHAVFFAFKKGVSYWYPDATRFIGYNPDVADKTIHEFPNYSYVVADLHGHMINIPNVILALLFIFYFTYFLLKDKGQKIKYLYSGLLGLLLAILYITNSWDFPIYFALFLFALAVSFLLDYRKNKKELANFILYPVIAFISWFILTLPYSLNFVNFAKGVEPTWTRSLLYQLGVLWGSGVFFAISYFTYQAFHFIKNKKERKKLDIGLLLPVLMSVTAIALFIFPEFFYLKDIYIKEYYRANTMFKLGYQAFILFGLISTIVFVYFFNKKSSSKLGFIVKNAWLSIALLFIISVSVYPYFSIRGYYGDLKKAGSLDGWQYLTERFPGDLAVISWLKNNVSGQPVVLEAVGDSYTNYARISANTGLPTVLGWPVHEWLWRGSYDIPGKRTAEVQGAYESQTLEYLQNFLQNYQIKYIVVGKLEHDKYKNLNEDNIKKVAKLVYSDSGTFLYQVE